MHAKYEVFIFNGSKVMAKVKLTIDRQTYKQTDKLTDHSIWGHKNPWSIELPDAVQACPEDKGHHRIHMAT